MRASILQYLQQKATGSVGYFQLTSQITTQHAART